MEDKYAHIRSAIEFCNLIRSTLGPRGMNKMVIGDTTILSNDGATIINKLKGGNPIVELIKSLAKSQEEAIGDGTTTTVLLTGQLLSNAINLLDKGVHPTIIINGYNIAKMEAMNILSKLPQIENKEKIIKTCFGTKVTKDISEKLTNLLISVKDIENLKLFRKNNSDPLDSEIYLGHVFEGFTINDRMKSEITGKIAVLDFPVNMKFDKFNVTSATELEKATNYDTDYKKRIVDKLKELSVECVFYTDTTPEFETYLTDQKIAGIVVFARDNVDGICNSTKATAISSLEQLNEAHLGQGHMKYVKGQKGTIYVDGDMETLILKGNTAQILDEMVRAIQDAVSLLKNDLSCVIGAGAVEMEIAKELREISKKVGGKEQLAIDKFIEAIESIPIILAENCGLDAIEILTLLKNLHNQGQKDMGVDPVIGISDARVREIFEPVLIKIHAINSATNITNLILKLDGIYQG
ncbi:MAG: TCP-1/cpn60 chaperonin family protein [Chloroflexi bacterium]|nr:TCP-1/cpn60 chaperonin family protein [Chloroflexota bacterium]